MPLNAQPRQLVFVKPSHSGMYGSLDALVGLGQRHQQSGDAGALHRAVGRQLVGTGRGWSIGLAVVLLAPYGQLALLVAHLGGEDALHTLVEGCHATLAQRLVGHPLIGCFLLGHCPQQVHRVHHCIVVVGDVNLIVALLWPELGPAAILILSAQQIFHRLVESLLVALVLRGLIDLGQIEHLHIRGSVVGGRVVAALLVAQHLCPLLVRQRARHVDVLGPSARHALIEQHLVANAAPFVTPVEFLLLVRRQVSAAASSLRLNRHNHQCQQEQKCL